MMKKFAILFVATFAMCLMSGESQAQCRGGGFGVPARSGFSISVGSGFGGFGHGGFNNFGGFGGGFYNVARPVYGGGFYHGYARPIYGGGFNRGFGGYYGGCGRRW